jgi:hypothetical protein
MAELLDGREELVHVHVQHPLGHAQGPTQPATAMIRLRVSRTRSG